MPDSWQTLDEAAGSIMEIRYSLKGHLGLSAGLNKALGLTRTDSRVTIWFLEHKGLTYGRITRGADGQTSYKMTIAKKTRFGSSACAKRLGPWLSDAGVKGSRGTRHIPVQWIGKDLVFELPERKDIEVPKCPPSSCDSL